LETVEPIYKTSIQEIDQQHLNGTIKNDYKDLAAKYYDNVSYLQQLKEQEDGVEAPFQEFLRKQKSNFNLSDFKNLALSVPTKIEHGKAVEEAKKPVSIDDLMDAYVYKQGGGDRHVFGTQAGKLEPSAQEAHDRLVGRFGVDGAAALFRQVQGGSSLEGGITGAYKKLEASITPEFKTQLEQRQKKYRDLQMGKEYYYGQFNTPDEKSLSTVNSKFADVVANLAGDQKAKIDGTNNLAEWLDASKPENLKKNLYQVVRKNNDFYLRLRRNDGAHYNQSDIPVSADYVNQMGVSTQETPFQQTFGRFLNLYNQQRTVEDLKSPQAENTAINRRAIGKYSVGFHLMQDQGGWVPYLYVRDKATGKVLGQGIRADFSVYTNDPNVPKEKKELFGNAHSILPEQDVIDKLNLIDENFINLTLNH
jgi:hypothetical protein